MKHVRQPIFDQRYSFYLFFLKENNEMVDSKSVIKITIVYKTTKVQEYFSLKSLTPLRTRV